MKLKREVLCSGYLAALREKMEDFTINSNHQTLFMLYIYMFQSRP